MKLPSERTVWFVTVAIVAMGLNIVTHDWRASLPTIWEFVALLAILAMALLVAYAVDAGLSSLRRRDRDR
ncbi:hypothetical protein [Nonomuraea sp. NPDC005650]|uniref:hypothetical protein n=1 Tax=Nonomuraea sp. NPDC005650 TaxID=3157045 RepID=UPI00339EEA03